MGGLASREWCRPAHAGRGTKTLALRLKVSAKTIRDKIMDTPFQEDFEEELKKQWERVSGGSETFTFAVRSSATAEDLSDASFAGQQETYLNVMGYEDLKYRVHLVFASLFTDRAISYSHDRGFEHEKVQLCATCQKMIRSETGAAGVMFSLDTESGFKDVVFVTSAWGLGETVVGGTVNPNEWHVFKPILTEGKNAIVSRTMGSKKCKMVYVKGGGTELVDITGEEQGTWSASDKEVEDLAVMAIKIEKHTAAPWTSSGPATVTTASSTSYRRPETVASQKKVGVIEDYKPHVPRRHHRSRAGHSGHHRLRRRHGEARTRRRVRCNLRRGRHRQDLQGPLEVREGPDGCRRASGGGHEDHVERRQSGVGLHLRPAAQRRHRPRVIRTRVARNRVPLIRLHAFRVPPPPSSLQVKPPCGLLGLEECP